MATTRIIPLHVGERRSSGTAIRKVIAYTINPGKTEQGELITGYACDPHTADAEFLLAKREYLERTGRYRGKDDIPEIMWAFLLYRVFGLHLCQRVG